MIAALLAFTATAAQGQLRVIHPESITPMPKVTVEEYEQIAMDIDQGEQIDERVGDLTVYDDLYSGYCSILLMFSSRSSPLSISLMTS